MSEVTARFLGTKSTFPTACLCWPLTHSREQAAPKLCRDNLQAGAWRTQEGKLGSPSACKRLNPFALLHTCSVHGQVGGTGKHSGTFHRELGSGQRMTEGLYGIIPTSKSLGSVCLGNNKHRIQNWCPTLPVQQRPSHGPAGRPFQRPHNSSELFSPVQLIHYIHLVFSAKTGLCPC